MNIDITKKSRDELLFEIEELKKENERNKHISTELDYQKEFINILFDTNPDSILITRYSDGIVLKANKGFTNIFGFQPDEIVGKNSLDIDIWVNPEDKQNIINILIEKNLCLNYEAEFKRKDGSRLVGLLSSRIYPHFQNLEVITVTRDITERKKIEESLQISEAKLKAIFNSVNIGIIVTDLNGKIILCNKNIKTMLGYDLEEFLGKTPFDITFPEDKEHSIRNFNKIINGDLEVYRIEKRYNRKDGTYIWADTSVLPIKNENGEVTSTIGIINDITRKKEYEERIKKLFKAVEQSPASIIITDKQGFIEYVNPKFCEISEYSEIEIIGKNANILYDDSNPKEVIEDFWGTILAGNEWRGELQVLKKNGVLYWEFIYISPIFNSGGEIINFLAVNEDLSERKKTEKELKELNQTLIETLNTKDKFFSIISHDLRGPFSVFLGLTDLLAKSAEVFSIEEIKKMSVTINQASNSLFELLNNLLEWSRTQTNSMPFYEEELELYQIICSIKPTINQIAKSKNIKIESIIEPNKYCFGDKKMITTIFRNLITNSIKFSNEYGKIEIGMIENNDDHSNYYTLYVKDNGIGMDMEIRIHLFQLDKKVSTKGTKGETGTGLGLLLCKEFVEKHKGKIWVDSEKGKGSTFYFTLPKMKNIVY